MATALSEPLLAPDDVADVELQPTEQPSVHVAPPALPAPVAVTEHLALSVLMAAVVIGGVVGLLVAALQQARKPI